MIRTCPACFSAADVTYERLPDGLIAYACSRRHEDGREHIWTMTAKDVLIAEDLAGDGVTDELMEPLSQCVHTGEPFAEYGVVDYRLRQDYPELFIAHVRDRGHHLLGGHQQATASGVRFGMALGRLARAGGLVRKYDRATGAWKYNGQITYWAKPPLVTGADVTWEQFCHDQGRSSEWTEADRRGLE